MNIFVRFGRPQSEVPLSLREVTTADAVRIVELAGVWAVARMSAAIPYPYHLKDAIDWIEGIDPDEIVRAIIVDGELVGVCGLVRLEDEQECAEIGYWIGEPYWGRGYATAAARQLIRIAFKEYGFSRLLGGHFADNPASARILEKLGFEELRTRARWCVARRRDVNAVEYLLNRPAPWWRPA